MKNRDWTMPVVYSLTLVAYGATAYANFRKGNFVAGWWIVGCCGWVCVFWWSQRSLNNTYLRLRGALEKWGETITEQGKAISEVIHLSVRIEGMKAALRRTCGVFEKNRVLKRRYIDAVCEAEDRRVRLAKIEADIRSRAEKARSVSERDGGEAMTHTSAVADMLEHFADELKKETSLWNGRQ